MNTKVTKTYPPMVYKIKEYLEKYCVGKENAKTYNQILDGQQKLKVTPYAKEEVTRITRG